ncbi:hypothetical protein P7K49_000186 [Saguinus oedipus]|uniref:SWIM-type domain-containing protein n=1 Tax=Saguinus oedipus TaxID=9490 RepID=A0ABQ9WBH6_SAGOE|nr:hypothetical protein P7K49_000186 [Saguinus oedipus]
MHRHRSRLAGEYHGGEECPGDSQAENGAAPPICFQAASAKVVFQLKLLCRCGQRRSKECLHLVAYEGKRQIRMMEPSRAKQLAIRKLHPVLPRNASLWTSVGFTQWGHWQELDIKKRGLQGILEHMCAAPGFTVGPLSHPPHAISHTLSQPTVTSFLNQCERQSLIVHKNPLLHCPYCSLSRAVLEPPSWTPECPLHASLPCSTFTAYLNRIMHLQDPLIHKYFIDSAQPKPFQTLRHHKVIDHRKSSESDALGITQEQGLVQDQEPQRQSLWKLEYREVRVLGNQLQLSSLELLTAGADSTRSSKGQVSPVALPSHREVNRDRRKKPVEKQQAFVKGSSQ